MTYKVVCAIDLGTNSTGCVFSTAKEPNRMWSFLTTSSGDSVQRVGSSVLLEPNGAVHSLGQKAQEKYSELVQDGQHEHWMFVKEFKLILYDRMNFKKNAKIKDSKGKTIDVLVVFAAVIRFLHQETLAAMRDRDPTIIPSDVRWVLTIPIVWNNVSRDFMKGAAEKAGIPPSQVLIVSEPTAVSVFAMEHQLHASLKTEKEQYAVLDCGGGKVDITIYEVCGSSHIQEIHKANLSPLGGRRIHAKLWYLLEEILGKDAVDAFIESDDIAAVEFIQNFDINTRKLKYENTKFNLRIPNDFVQIYKQLYETKKMQLPQRLLGQVELMSDKLIFNASVIIELFRDSVDGILEHLRPLLSNTRMENLKTILMVGGLAVCSLLRDGLARELPNMHIIVPDEPQLVVVKGAVLCGHGRKQIRVTRGTGNHLFVAAIDFGTSFSGYAFSPISNPEDIKCFDWPDETQAVHQKTSTCVLFKPDGKLDSVGFKADEKYASLIESDDHSDWSFFKGFKMTLYNVQTIDRNLALTDVNGKKMDALVVFAAVIQYMKDHMKTQFDNSFTGILESDIKWVLTVPAIWTDAAKQFMREAAEKAGIDSNQLSLALEPEVASFYCRKQRMERTGQDILPMQPNTKYMVVDCGGGTVDITVHEVMRDHKIKEILKANGGCWGGNTVDEAFYEMLTNIFGSSVMHKFRTEFVAEDRELRTKFEIKKKTIGQGSEDVTIQLLRLKLIHEELNLDPIEEKIQEKYQNDVKWTRDKLRFSANTAKSLFGNSTQYITELMKNLFKCRIVEGVKVILMVGGYSKSPLLQECIKSAFPSIRVIIPNGTEIAVVKGAVLYGHEPQPIYSRICRFTYGVEVPLQFEKGIDDPKLSYTNSKGKKMCRKRFQIHANENDEIVLESPPVSHVVRLECKDVYHLSIPVYVSRSGCPRYTTNCTKIGEVKIDIDDPVKEKERDFKIEMLFGHTESTVKVTDIASKKVMTAKFDFLG